jgi:hypothetical protein
MPTKKEVYENWVHRPDESIVETAPTATDYVIIFDDQGNLKCSTVTNFFANPDGALTIGENDTGYDVTFFGDTAGKKFFFDASADTTYLTCTVDVDGTITVGVDDTGYDVKFFGATSGAYMLWDESEDDLILAGASGLSMAGTGGISISGVTTTGISITGDSTDAIKISTGTITTAINVDVGIVDVATRVFCSGAPASYTTPALSVGIYGTPVVDTAVVDNIAFTVNMSTATNKTSGDTSTMAAYISASNTAATANNKIQSLLVSTTVNADCYDAYGVQGHLTLADNDGHATTSNGGTANLVAGSFKTSVASGLTATGTVSGVLITMDGTGTVTGTHSGLWMDTVVAVDNGILISGSGTVTTGLNLAGTYTTGITVGGTVTTGIAVTGTAAVATTKAVRGVMTVNNANFGDGYGLGEFELTLTGTTAGHVAGLSSWVNIITGTATNYVCAQTNGVYEEATGTISGATVIFGMRMQSLLAEAPGESYPFSCVSNTNVITALFSCNAGSSDMGTITDNGSDSGKLVPLYKETSTGTTYYVKLYAHS